jgi:hypothetical protein
MTSLGLDEAALVVNIIERHWSDLLFQPLLHAQIAPIGFLALEKASISVAGNAEVVLRFFPFLMSLASLVLFWRLSSRYLSPPVMLAALVVFAVSPTLILYAGIAKQYSGDIAITLFLLWMTLRFLEGPTTLPQAALLGAAGAVVLLLSHPAVLTAFGLGVLLLVRGRRAGKPGPQLLAVFAGWLLGAAIATWVSLSTLSPETGVYMQSGWKYAWVPPPWRGLDAFLWLPSRLGTILTYSATGVHPPLRSWIKIGIAAFYSLLLPLGYVSLFRKDLRRAVVLAIPVIMAIVAVVFRLLPLAGRVSLFLAPVLLIGCFAGIDQIRAWIPQRERFVAYGIMLGFAILPAVAGLARNAPPIAQGGTRPVLEDIKAHWLPGDRLVVARGTWTFRLVDYYGDLLGLEDWSRLDRLEGEYSTEEILRSYLQRIDAYRGSPRVWFHLEGTTPCEEEAILGYLDAIGRRLHFVEAHLEWGHRISGHLYDLSDPVPLASTSADRYGLPQCELLPSR